MAVGINFNQDGNRKCVLTAELSQCAGRLGIVQRHSQPRTLLHKAGNMRKLVFCNAYRIKNVVPAMFQKILGFFQGRDRNRCRSEEHTSELQSLMRISYAVFCLKQKKKKTQHVHSIYIKNISK